MILSLMDSPFPKKLILPVLLPLLLLFSRGLAELTILVICLVFLHSSFKNKNLEWFEASWFRFALLFWGYLIFINTPLSIDISTSLFYALTFIRWPLFAAALAYWVFDTFEQKKYFIVSLTCTLLFIIADTTWQYFYGVDWFGLLSVSETRLTGPFRKPIPGIVTLKVFFIALFALAFFQPLLTSVRSNLFLLLGLLAGLLFIFITGERMAFILFICACLFILSALFYTYPNQRKKILSYLILGLSLFIVTAAFQPHMAQRTIYSIAPKLLDFSNSDYGVIFRATLTIWQNNPILGSGLHTFRSVCEEMQLLTACSHSHNVYVQLLAETGLLGLLLFSLMVASIIQATLRPLIKVKLWLIPALSLSILMASFWPLMGGVTILNNWIAAISWLGVGWVLTVALKPHELKLSQPIKQKAH